ncbi:YegP family protein [Spongiimicrobium salis]|uniref:YegP family protein n=1 Tax=Spongiimicrobium salis TaxID=1667022 RepID=UPI00374DCF9A
MIEIKKGTDNSYSFSLSTSNGATLLNSVAYSNEEEVNKTLEKLPALVQYHSVFERKTDHDGKFRFRLKDRKGIPIGHSEQYSSEAGMENGIKNLKKRIASLSQSKIL